MIRRAGRTVVSGGHSRKNDIVHGVLYQKGGMCDIGSKYNIAGNVLTCQICNNITLL